MILQSQDSLENEGMLSGGYCGLCLGIQTVTGPGRCSFEGQRSNRKVTEEVSARNLNVSRLRQLPSNKAHIPISVPDE